MKRFKTETTGNDCQGRCRS